MDKNTCIIFSKIINTYKVLKPVRPGNGWIDWLIPQLIIMLMTLR